MKRISCKIISFLIMLCLLTAICSVSLAAESVAPVIKLAKYTALGDSIPFGYGSSVKYVDLFFNYLQTDRNKTITELSNYGKSGLTSSGLLEMLNTDAAVRDDISKSAVVSISIGGNNLLKPAADAICEAFGVSNDNNPNVAKELADAYEKDPDKDAKMAKLMAFDNLPAKLMKAADDFKGDWTKIIDEIKEINPKAEIYAMTLYNPFDRKDQFYNAFDIIVSMLNSAINSDNRYTLVNTNVAFRDYKGQQPLINFNLLKGDFDPHPTDFGQKMIFKVHLAAYLNKDKKFADANITKAEYVYLLVKLLGINAIADSNFADIKKTDYYYQALGIAKKLKVITGDTKNKFIPNEQLTRQNMLVFAANALKASGKTLKSAALADLPKYKDANKIQSSAKLSIALLVKNGYITVPKSNTLNPSEKVKRSEVAGLLYNLMLN